MESKCRSHRAEQVEITLWRTGIGGEGLGEPWVLVAAVVRHQVDQHPQAAVVRPRDELVGVLEGAELRQDVAVVGDVVPAVSQRRGIPGAQAIIAEGLPTDENPGGRWWVDVGLGDALHDPLPLVEGEYVQGPLRFAIEAVEPGGVGDWRLVHDPQDGSPE